ncbi:MAG: CDP-diacylglycerol--glycerol-3-phosphate 3-phosphatidyltransferase [Candidatus Aminicenantes bacterium]|nr:CDP-diacylglycerol--glycerol-3-phosphate 3-phosphatidyltransferase [Candidatus Aminicenantes bacterium]
MNLPNALTVFRIALIPVFVAVFLTPFRGHEAVALAVFLAAALTDLVDGLLARLTGTTTELGALLDPIADKLLVAASVVCLVGAGRIPSWVAAVVIGREIAVTGFRSMAASKGVLIPAGWAGKVKMNLETYALAFYILGPKALGGWFVIGRVMLGSAVVLAVASAVEYFVKFGPAVLGKKLSEDEKPAGPSPANPSPRRSRR